LSKKHQIKTENLSRFIVYILGHRPYEFGLVPDTEGFITYKELIWAIHEEPGWGYVRQGNINEVLLGKDRALFQAEDDRIRALDRRWELDLESPAELPSKLLFIGIRKRAHPVIMEKGLREITGSHHILSSLEMAERIGRRRDQQPVLLEVMADKAQKEGILFHAFGNLFLTKEIQAGYIAGPPVPKDVIKSREAKPKKEEIKHTDFQAGTFVLDENRDMDRSRRKKDKKRKGWKEEARKFRRKR